MTMQVEAPTRNNKLANMLLAAGGDIPLVVEQYNKNPSHNNTNSLEVLEAFIDEATASVKMQDNVKALILLNFLQILSDVKLHLSVALPEFAAPELIKTMQMVVEGITALMPKEPKQQDGNNTNILMQFGADQAHERLMSRLDNYSAAHNVEPVVTSEES